MTRKAALDRSPWVRICIRCIARAGGKIIIPVLLKKGAAIPAARINFHCILAIAPYMGRPGLICSRIATRAAGFQRQAYCLNQTACVGVVKCHTIPASQQHRPSGSAVCYYRQESIVIDFPRECPIASACVAVRIDLTPVLRRICLGQSIIAKYVSRSRIRGDAVAITEESIPFHINGILRSEGDRSQLIVTINNHSITEVPSTQQIVVDEFIVIDNPSRQQAGSITIDVNCRKGELTKLAVENTKIPGAVFLYADTHIIGSQRTEADKLHIRKRYWCTSRSALEANQARGGWHGAAATNRRGSLARAFEINSA